MRQLSIEYRFYAFIYGGSFRLQLDESSSGNHVSCTLSGVLNMNHRPIIFFSALVLACATSPIAMASSENDAPPAADDSIIVKLADKPKAQTIELICNDGSYRSSQSASTGVATFSKVPGGSCTLSFKGENPAKFTPVSRGNAYHCNIIGQTAVCK